MGNTGGCCTGAGIENAQPRPESARLVQQKTTAELEKETEERHHEELVHQARKIQAAFRGRTPKDQKLKKEEMDEGCELILPDGQVEIMTSLNAKEYIQLQSQTLKNTNNMDSDIKDFLKESTKPGHQRDW